MDMVAFAIPFFFGAILVELYYGYKIGRNTYRVNDAINSLSLGTLSTLTKLVVLDIGAATFTNVYEHRLMTFDGDNLGHWVIAIVLYDFAYYWFHRISHERKIFWASHVVHHQSEDYNLSTALRQTSTGFLLTWVFYIPLFYLGLPVEMFVTIASCHLIYQFWIHTQHVPKLGRLFEYFMISPSNHRVHHGRNNEYLDKNHGGLFLVWDRLFGTYQEEREDIVIRYGTTTPLANWNPAWANLEVFSLMYADLLAAKGVRQKLYVLVSPTHWSLRPSNPVNKGAHLKFDPDIRAGRGKVVLTYMALSIVFTFIIANEAHFGPIELITSVAFTAVGLIVLGQLLNGQCNVFSICALFGLLSLSLFSIDQQYGFWQRSIVVGMFSLPCLLIVAIYRKLVGV